MGRDQAPKTKIKAIAFDAFPIFDPRPVFALAEELFPGNGLALSDEWRTRQFEYTWLRVVVQRYADFWQVTDDALIFAANKLKLDLNAEKREKLMSGYLKFESVARRAAGAQRPQEIGAQAGTPFEPHAADASGKYQERRINWHI